MKGALLLAGAFVCAAALAAGQGRFVGKVVVEWLDDPFIRNFIPAWGNIGQEGSCSFSLETGDPVTGTTFEVTMNGFTYHPEDLVFLPWFAREVPSTSVNGWYTFLNSFSSPQFICQP